MATVMAPVIIDQDGTTIIIQTIGDIITDGETIADGEAIIDGETIIIEDTIITGDIIEIINTSNQKILFIS